MKKILAICMALVMIASLCTSTVFAADGLGDSSADVYIKVNGTGVTINKYSVDIEFGSMHFVYGASAIWDTELHDYVVSSGAGWAPESEGADKIKIVNHSDLPIAYSTAFEEISEKYGKITLATDPAAGQIEKCPIQAVSAPSRTLTVALSGDPKTFTDGFVELAKVIVTISPVS